nr:type IV secretion system DNA-binding domain-containing protein [Kineosporia babensis]
MVPPPAEILAGGRSLKALGRASLGERAVGLAVADARQHVHIVGSTGVGKSTLIARMVLSDVHAGRGVIVIDPKGDLALDILDRLPAQAVPRLTLIDPAQGQFGGGSARFNPLEVGHSSPEVVVDTVVSIFRNIFREYWGPRMDEVLRACCLTLMRSEHNRLDLIPRLLSDTTLRRELAASVADNPGLHDFWSRYETWMLQGQVEQLTGAARARLRQVLMRPFATDTFAGGVSTFDMTDVLNGGVLIARLPSGEMGADTSRLMGSLLVALVWQAATARAALPESRRRDAALYVDEAHTMLNLDTSLEDMLPQARAFHLSMVLAHQNLDQFDPAAQQALDANARTKIFFTASPRDARQMAQHTEPYLSERDLTRLPAYTAAVRPLISNKVAQPFTMSTVPLSEAPRGTRRSWRSQVAQHAPEPQSTRPDPGTHQRPERPERPGGSGTVKDAGTEGRS